MKITISPSEPQGSLPLDCRYHTSSIETENDDVDLDEAIEMFRKALIGFEFHPDTVHACLRRYGKCE